MISKLIRRKISVFLIILLYILQKWILISSREEKFICHDKDKGKSEKIYCSLLVITAWVIISFVSKFIIFIVSHICRWLYFRPNLYVLVLVPSKIDGMRLSSKGRKFIIFYIIINYNTLSFTSSFILATNSSIFMTYCSLVL